MSGYDRLERRMMRLSIRAAAEYLELVFRAGRGVRAFMVECPCCRLLSDRTRVISGFAFECDRCGASGESIDLVAYDTERCAWLELVGHARTTVAVRCEQLLRSFGETPVQS